MLSALAAASIALGLSACSDPTEGGASDDGGASRAPDATALNVYLYQAPASAFSPMAPLHGPDGLIMSMIYDGLYGVDNNYELQPHLAVGPPEISPDGTRFTFELRDDLVWSDGEPFTADDVVFTYNLMANPASGSSRSGLFAEVKGAAEVAAGEADSVSGLSAPDDTTFVIETTSPDIGLVGLVGNMWILPEHVLGDVPVDQMSDHEFFREPTVGLGPYTFVEYRTDQYVELVANENYRDDVAIDTVYLRPVTSDVATAQLGTGEMDLVQISPADLDAVESLDDVEVESAPGPGFIRLALNQTQERFADPRVGQAIMMAVDRQGIVDEALAGKGSTLVSSFMGDALPDDLNQYDYDPEAAERLLSEAGWNPSDPVELIWIPGQRDRDTAANVVQSQLQDVGMNVTLRQVQPSELGDLTDNATFDMFLFGGGNYATEPWAVYPINGCDQAAPQGGNLPRFCNEELDALMKQANATPDEQERLELYRQAARIENEAVPYIWLYNPDSIWAYNTRLEGFIPSGDFTNGFWNAADWSISEE